MPHSSFFLQGTRGNLGHSELVFPRPTGGGVCLLTRDNDEPGFPWGPPLLLFGSAEDIISARALQNRATAKLEVVGIQNGRLFHTSGSDASDGRWFQPKFFAKTVDVQGHPAFIQGLYGINGNFEVVAPLRGGGLGHWWRDNDTDFEWRGPNPFGEGSYEAVSMIQSNFGPAPGNFEIVARRGNSLDFYFFDGQWVGPLEIASGVSGAPCLMQGFTGVTGNFELAAPMEGGGLGYWFRDNDDPALPWIGPVRFGEADYSAAGLLVSNLGGFSNLEVAAFTGEAIHHFFRDEAGAWQGPTIIHHLPPLDPAMHGRTSIVAGDAGHVGIHAVLLRSGKVLLFGYADTNDVDPKASLFDPAALTFKAVHPHHVFFCAGHSSLADGRIFLAAGHHERRMLSYFDPESEAWSHPKQNGQEMLMEVDRWYPTCTTLPDGRVMIFSGNAAFATKVENNFQYFTADPPSLSPMVPVPLPLSAAFAPPNPNPGMALYPFVYVLPGGKVLVYSHRAAKLYDLATDSWEPGEMEINSSLSRSYVGAGTSVLLPLRPPDYAARVLVTGGGGVPLSEIDTLSPAREDAEILDLSVDAPAWRFTNSMSFPRVLADSVLLPDGKVLVLGGSASGRSDAGTSPVLEMEIFDPETETWSIVNRKLLPHMYHSTAVLLPDATVLMTGKDGIFQFEPYQYPERRIEIFEPPYLFQGPRPVINAVQEAIGYGQEFAVETDDGFAIGSACLIRPGATTHSFNMDQRYVALEIREASAGRVALAAPPDSTIAPPGYYLLFILSHSGVPGVARFVRLQ